MRPLIYIGGTFDLYHKGHVRLFAAAHARGRVVVVLNTNEFATEYKRKPIMSLAERFFVVQACRYVDHVDVNYGGADSKPALLRWKPNYIAHGDDWTGDALMHQLGIDGFFLEEQGIEMLYLEYTQGISTTDIEFRVLRAHNQRFSIERGLTKC